MMQIRCQNCAWPFDLSLDGIARAVAEAQAKQESFHLLSCPQCGHVTRVDVETLRQNLPGGHPLPEVKVSPPPQVKASSAESALKWNVAVVPAWDPKKKRDATQLLFRAVMACVGALWLITLIWVFTRRFTEAPAQALQAGADMAVVLAPVLAAAAGVERFLETIFGIIENRWMTLVAYFGHGLRWLHNAETEVQQARKWLADLSHEASLTLAQMPTTMEQFQGMIPDSIDHGQTIEEWQALAVSQAQKRLDTINSMIGLAQTRVTDAERELASAVDSPIYKDAKKAATIVLGLWLGVLVAGMGQIQMFALLGIGLVPASIDVLITGLVIGSGSYPVHSLVGILQQTKDTLDGAQSFLKSKSAQLRDLAS
jgi:hypothetical protein